MFNVVLVAPEIPPNTGNVIRLCANTGARLHLVKPLGFARRQAHEACGARLPRVRRRAHPRVVRRVSRIGSPESGPHVRDDDEGEPSFAEVAFEPGDWFVFGSESKGLADAVRERFDNDHRIRLPMRPGNRSLNSLEHRRRDGLRSVAPAGVRGRRLISNTHRQKGRPSERPFSSSRSAPKGRRPIKVPCRSCARSRRSRPARARRG